MTAPGKSSVALLEAVIAAPSRPSNAVKTPASD